MQKYIFFLIIFFTTTTFAYAPVSEGIPTEPIPKNGIHTVTKGETFYSIAWRYGLNYQTLAKHNHLKSPYLIETGQKLYLRGNAPYKIIYAQQNYLHNVKKLLAQIQMEPTAEIFIWNWPAHGKVIRGYSNLNKGINIAGKKGNSVFAAAPGKVVYSGNGLRSYGNLIILKHNNDFLTAYAHNARILVKQDQWVRAGQKIAEMGNTGTNRVMLHFEIRKKGAPVNPIKYLVRKGYNSHIT